MAEEYLIQQYLRPGFPKESISEKSYRTVIEYIGPKATLLANSPAQNTVWGDYNGLVTGSSIDPIEGTTKGILRVQCEYFHNEGSTGGGLGSAQEVTYEDDWETFVRSMYEHPEFAIGEGGTYELDSQDVAQIEAWKNEVNTDLKEEYKFDVGNGEVTLSTNAKMFARGLELGQETYEDYAPVVRRKTIYVNGGPPADTDVGTKDTPPSAANGPSGYQWRKSASRGTRADGQTRYERDEEWIGAIKVLVDRDAIYWTAPA